MTMISTVGWDALVAGDQIVLLKEATGIVESLLADLRQRLGFWREHDIRQSVQIVSRYLDARVGE